MSPRGSSCPYVGLQPYREKDQEYFFGRDRDQRIISANLYSNSLTILYGASGVGKSSVLNAGIVPRLRQKPRTAVVVFRDWQYSEYLAMLKAECIKAVELAQKKALTTTPSLPLDELLFNAGQEFGGTILILLDQFEEYFIYQPESETDHPFESEFACAVNRPEVDANFLISLREDGLAKLDRFSGRIPNLMENTLRLQHLDAEAAEEAIRKPLDVYNRYASQASEKVSIEDTLVHEILRQVRSRAELTGVEQTKRHDRIDQIVTPFLQLVLERLWKAEMNDSSHVLRLSTFDRLKGAQQIVRTHLDEVMNSLLPAEQASAARIFEHLVTPSGAKRAQLLTDLAKWAKLDKDQLAPLLEILSADNRILRSIEPPPDQPEALQYEVFHDVLAPAVLEWRREYERKETARKKLWARVRAGLVVSLILLATAGAIKWMEQREAQRVFSRKLAEQARAKLDTQLDLALLLSLEANHSSDTAEAKSSLAMALQKHPKLSTFLHGHERDVMCVAFSPEGKSLTSGSVDGTVFLWDVATRQFRSKNLPSNKASVWSVALSPDGKTLALSSADGTIILWDVANQKQIGEPLTGLESSVLNVTFSPEGKTLASASADGNVVIWNLTGLPDAAHMWAQVSSLAFSPDGKTLAVASGDKTITLWNVKNGRKRTLTGHAARVSSVTFSPNGKTLASGDADGNIVIWNFAKQEQFGQPVAGQRGAPVSSLAFSPDGKTLAVASGDKTIKLLDAATGQESAKLIGHATGVSSVAFSPDQKTLASGSEDGTIILWDVTGHEASVSSVAFSPDGKTLASGSMDGTIILWDVTNRKQLAQPLTAHKYFVSSVAFSPKGETLASGSMDGTIILWDVATQEQIGNPLTGNKGSVSSAAFSPDGKILALGSGDGTIILWDVTTQKRVSELMTGHKASVSSAAFSPDGKTLASGSMDGTIILWDVVTPKRVSELMTGHKASVSSVAFSPKGETLVSGSTDGVVILWDVANRKQLAQPLTAHKYFVSSVAFSPDGKTLASGSADGTIIFWDVATQKRVSELMTGHKASVSSVAFSPDGKTLASGSADGAVIFWDLDLRFESLKSRACRRANRNLTGDEWSPYMGDKPYNKTCPDLPSGESLTTTNASVGP